jgi:hypothetical protein
MNWDSEFRAFVQNHKPNAAMVGRYGDSDAYQKSARRPSMITSLEISQIDGAIRAKTDEIEMIRRQRSAAPDSAQLYCDEVYALVASLSLVRMKYDVGRWQLLYRTIEKYLNYRILIASQSSKNHTKTSWLKGATRFTRAQRMSANNSDHLSLLLKIPHGVFH